MWPFNLRRKAWEIHIESKLFQLEKMLELDYRCRQKMKKLILQKYGEETVRQYFSDQVSDIEKMLK